jgi:hypothetical protein
MNTTPREGMPELPAKWFAEARELERGDDYSRGAAAARETLALELQSALASQPTQGGGDGWFPIESAPKNGRIVDLWANGQRYPNVAWCGIGRCWRKVNRDGKTLALAADVVPTHWRLPPDAPAALPRPQPESDGPEFFDGCDKEGFVGGCERMGCHRSFYAEAERLNLAVCNAAANGAIDPDHPDTDELIEAGMVLTAAMKATPPPPSDAAQGDGTIAAIRRALEDTMLTGTGFLEIRRIAPEDVQLATPPSQPVRVDEALSRAYGYLWHVNHPEDIPIGHPYMSADRAATEARKELRDLLTSEQRGTGINWVRQMILAAHKGEGNG